MKLCDSYRPGVRRPERPPAAVPAGLLIMGLLVMTFESALAALIGLSLGAWGAADLFLRGREITCCLRCRKKKLARGEEAPSCLPV